MIIQCENCSRKFRVGDEDIPKEGRMVQCSNCLQKWFQVPIKDQSSNIEKDQSSNIEKDQSSNIEKKQSSNIEDADEKVTKMEFEASDGRVYRFMGSQWAEILRSGKTGLLAKRSIGAELNRRAGIVNPKKVEKELKKLQRWKLKTFQK